MKKNIIFNKKLTTKDKVTYGLGDVANQFIYGSLSAFILIFWTDVVGIAAATASTMILISKVWDGINDPLMGAFIDRHEFNGEKARPYFKWFAIPFGIAAVISFITPDASMPVKILYAFIAYNITNMIYTIINIPYGILATKMTSDVNERGTLNVYRMAFAMSGYAFVSLFVPSAVQKFGYFPAFLTLGVISVAIWFYVYSNSYELPIDTSTEKENTVKFNVAARKLIKNRVWIILTLGMLFANIASSMMGGAAAYYVQYYLGNPALVGIYLLLPTIGQIISLSLFADRGFKKFGKIKMTQLCLFFASVFSLLIFVFVGSGSAFSLWLLAFLLILTGMAIGPIMSATFAMLGDSIEYGEYKTGVRVEGLTYAGASLGQKVGAGLGTALVGYILAFSGYVPNAQQSAEALMGIRVVYVVAPIIFYISYLIALQFNPLDKIYKDVERELIKRRGLTKEINE